MVIAFLQCRFCNLTAVIREAVFIEVINLSRLSTMNGLKFSQKANCSGVAQRLHVWAYYKISDFTPCQTQVVVNL